MAGDKLHWGDELHWLSSRDRCASPILDNPLPSIYIERLKNKIGNLNK